MSHRKSLQISGIKERNLVQRRRIVGMTKITNAFGESNHSTTEQGC